MQQSVLLQHSIRFLKADPGKQSASVVQKGLPIGTYFLKETKQSPGCAVNDTVYKFEITADKETSTFEVVKEDSSKADTYDEQNGIILNIPNRVKFEIIKVDESDKPIKDVVFRVKYFKTKDDCNNDKNAVAKWWFHTGSKGEIHYVLGNYNNTWTGPAGHVYNSSPLFKTADDELAMPAGYISVKEVWAPDEYELDPTTYTFVLDPKDATKKDGEVFVFVLRPNGNDKFVNKKTGDKWKVRVRTKKIDPDGHGLKGAVFSVWKDKECTDEHVGEITSGDDGTTDILEVKGIPGTKDKITLYLKEEVAPDGYSISDTIYEVTYEKSTWDNLPQNDKDDGGELKDVKVDAYDGIPNNPGQKIRVNVKKVDEDGNPLEGAKFGVYLDLFCTKLATPDAFLTSEGEYSNYFSYSVSEDEEVFYLYCKEIEAPEGYSLSTEVHRLEFTKE